MRRGDTETTGAFLLCLMSCVALKNRSVLEHRKDGWPVGSNVEEQVVLTVTEVTTLVHVVVIWENLANNSLFCHQVGRPI